MRTESVLALLLATIAVRVPAQEVEFDRATQVRNVSFVVGPGPTPRDLHDQIATRGRGSMIGLRRTLRWVPFMPAVVDRPFVPVDVQRDKERLRRHYTRLGYPHATVEYDVRRDPAENVVDVTFRIEPGPPVLVASVTVDWDSAGPSPGTLLGFDLISTPVILIHEGDVLEQATIPPTVASITRWFEDRGYAFASVEAEIAVDSSANRADVKFMTHAGPRTRIGGVDIEGNVSVPTDAIEKLLDVRPGDWYSRARLDAAGKRIAALDLISRATFEIQPAAPTDTVIGLVLKVREQPSRAILGEAGYTTDGGIAGQATWTHRNIFSGAQTLTVDVAGQSGVLAIAENPDKFVRTGTSLRLPVQGRANLSLNFGPYVEYRNDYRDRSVELGFETTLLYQLAALSSIALRHQIATRRISEYRFGDISGGLDVIELLQLQARDILDTLGTRINTNIVSLSAILGNLDAPTDPVRGFIVEPTIAVTIPGEVSTTEYLTASFRASGYLPLTRTLSFATRVGGGRIFPLGKSVPENQDEGLRGYFRLRDVLFTAGGSSDVRGWSSRLLGPKFPQFTIRPEGDSAVLVVGDRYIPIGGFNMMHGTVELRFPLAFLGPRWSGHSFLDAGRVWTDDERFTSSEDPLGVEKLFWGSGLGFDFATPIGSIRFALAAKLNPSILDLADPDEAARALLTDSLDSLTRHEWHRLQLHFSFGRRL